jgi:hypothetical protein
LLFSLLFEFLTSLGLLSLPFRGGKSAPTDSVIVRESGRSSIPPAPVIEPKSCGVMDTPAFAGYDGGVLRVIACRTAVTAPYSFRTAKRGMKWHVYC